MKRENLIESKKINGAVVWYFFAPGWLRRLGCALGLHPVPRPRDDRRYHVVECACGAKWLYRHDESRRFREKLRVNPKLFAPRDADAPERHRTRVYLAGKMLGVKFYNFLAFDMAKIRLEHLGYDVISPVDLDREDGFDVVDLPDDHDYSEFPAAAGLSREYVIDRDLDALSDCDAVYLLNGWENSKGARAEKAVAEWRGLRVLRQADHIGMFKIGGRHYIHRDGWCERLDVTDCLGDVSDVPEDLPALTARYFLNHPNQIPDEPGSSNDPPRWIDRDGAGRGARS